MSIVRTFLADTGSDSIINDQKATLDAVVNKEWPQYKLNQDKEQANLDSIANQLQIGLTFTSQQTNQMYSQAYHTLFQANSDFFKLKSDWRHIADMAASASKAVSSIGLSQTLPIYLAVGCISVVLLVCAIRSGITSFVIKMSLPGTKSRSKENYEISR